MERNERVLTFHSPKVHKIKGNRKYQRPTLPTENLPNASMPPQEKKQRKDQMYSYIRMLCGSLCGYGLLMFILTSPLNWVQFLVTSNGLELYAGLWTLCHHELCWSHIPKPPFYIQYSRTCFILSTLPILRSLGWLFSSCFPKRENVITNLDLKVSMLSFISATCLFFGLYLFLQQVQWHTRYAMDADFLWPYYLNWLSDILYMCAGILSFLNYSVSRFQVPDKNVTVVPREMPRLGIGPVTPVHLLELKSHSLTRNL
uniref:transmembrane protein 202 n=1 Tax=Jaculus jaculus TaxID=51337 RepID=UPI001E1B2FA4|nr:transmembrane protein 202 [Jaculus jaculus]